MRTRAALLAVWILFFAAASLGEATAETPPPSPLSLHSFTAPESVEAAGRLRFAAVFRSPATGIRAAAVVLGDRPEPEGSTWREAVRLTRDPQSGRWAGSGYAPLVLLDAAPQQIWIHGIRVATVTGGEEWLPCGGGGDGLPAAACAIALTAPSVEPAFQASPLLDLLHPGPLDFFAWSALDGAYLQSLLERAPQNPDGVRELLAAELPLLRSGMDGLLGEIYTDQTLSLRLATPNTAGKRLALAAAIRGRLLLWTELDRLTGPAGGIPLTAGTLARSLSLLDFPGIRPLERELYDRAGPLFAQRTVELIRESAIAPDLLAQPMARDQTDLRQLSLVRNVLWLLPFSSEIHNGFHATFASNQGIALFLPDRLPDAFPFYTVAHEIGHRFHDIYLEGRERDRLSPEWLEYLAIRGVADQAALAEAGYYGRLRENFAEDFARAVLPAELARQRARPFLYGDLLEDPPALERFRAFLEDLQRRPLRPALTVAGLTGALALGPAERELTGSWIPGREVWLWRSAVQPVHLLSGRSSRGRVLVSVATADASGRWRLLLPPGGPALELVQVEARDGENLPLESVRFFHLDHAGLGPGSTTRCCDRLQ